MDAYEFDAQLSRLASALDTSVEDLLLHAPANCWSRGTDPSYAATS